MVLFSPFQLPSPSTIHDLRTPAIIVNKAQAQTNAAKMQAIASKHNVELRPHCKTHKTIQGAMIATNGRKSKIVVSTLSEARFYGNNEVSLARVN